MGFERDLFREAKLTKGQAPMRRHGPPGGGAEAVWRDGTGLSSPDHSSPGHTFPYTGTMAPRVTWFSGEARNRIVCAISAGFGQAA
jgi:hypothetical protein